MGGAIDATGKAGDDDESSLAEIARHSLGKLDAGRRGIARPDDRHHGLAERGQLAAHREQRRRIVDHLQPQRIFRLAHRHESNSQRPRRLDFALRIGARIDSGPGRRPAALRQLRQRRKRRARAAIVIDQGPEGARSRYYGANGTGSI